MVSKLLFALALTAAVCLTIGVLMGTALAAPPVQDQPRLLLVKTADGDGTVMPGQTVRFTITVTNTGVVTATGVVVQDDYDEAALPTVNTGASGAQNDGHVITWLVGDLAPGAAWSACYDATAAAVFPSGVLTVSNAAVASVGDVAVAQTNVVLRVRAPQLILSRQRVRVDDEGDPAPGAVLRYTIRYSNSGMANATNVVLEEVYDSTVVQQVANISGGGQMEGNRIRWNLGTLAAGGSGEVSYEATLKPALTQGDNFEVRHQATIQADGVERLSSSDAFTLHTPLLAIERERTDLNGGAIEPGDTLQFTIKVINSGQAEALGLVVRDDFYEQVVAEISNISAGGSEADGAVEWTLTAPLDPGAEQVFSYRVRLIGEIAQSTTVANTATLSIRGVEVARTQTTMTIEPSQTVSPTTVTITNQPQVFEQKPETLAWLVGVLAGVALLTLVGTALGGPALMKDRWNPHYLRTVTEGTVVIVLVGAVLILAMGSGIKQDGAVSILSIIAGYVFGRTVSGINGSRDASGGSAIG